eukprot:743493-Rhodomonas_salina.1
MDKTVLFEHSNSTVVLLPCNQVRPAQPLKPIDTSPQWVTDSNQAPTISSSVTGTTLPGRNLPNPSRNTHLPSSQEARVMGDGADEKAHVQWPRRVLGVPG